MFKTRRKVVTKGFVVVLAALLTACGGCVFVRSEGRDCSEAKKVSELEEQIIALESQMQEKQEEIAEFTQQSGAADLEVIRNAKRQQVQSLQADLFRLEREKVQYEAEIEAHELMGSQDEIQNTRLKLERAKAQLRLLRKLLDVEEGEAQELAAKYSALLRLKEELSLLHDKRGRVLQRIDRLSSVQDPCGKDR
jgi:DNA repair exonuclease SbcCD ATPase subunit